MVERHEVIDHDGRREVRVPDRLSVLVVEAAVEAEARHCIGGRPCGTDMLSAPLQLASIGPTEAAPLDVRDRGMHRAVREYDEVHNLVSEQNAAVGVTKVVRRRDARHAVPRRKVVGLSALARNVAVNRPEKSSAVATSPVIANPSCVRLPPAESSRRTMD